MPLCLIIFLTQTYTVTRIEGGNTFCISTPPIKTLIASQVNAEVRDGIYDPQTRGIGGTTGALVDFPSI